MLEIIECEQGTDEWFQARLGIPTGSMFSTVLAKGRNGGVSKTRQKYLYQLAGEVITQEPMESFSNAHMERGHVMEIEARNEYMFSTDTTVELVGFMRNGNKGASPDGLIGSDGLWEAKSRLPHIQIEVLFKDRIPPESIAQVQGQLWVSEREWCDFVSYWPGLPLFVKRAYRDEKYIANLSKEVDQFNEELQLIVENIRKMQ